MMENARKMILVPAETVDRMKEPPLTSGKPLANWQKEATKILDNTGLADDEKLINYLQIMHRLLRFNDQRRKPLKFLFGDRGAYKQDNAVEKQVHQAAEEEEAEVLPLVTPPDEPPVLHREQAPEKLRYDVGESSTSAKDSKIEEILETVPKTYRTKGSVLLNRLSKSKIIQLCDNGGVKINGETIKGANIADLLNDALRTRKTVPVPQGSEEFCKVLAKLNVPQELIGNSARWELIREHAAERTSPDSPVFDTLWPQTPVKRSKRDRSPDPEDTKLASVRRKLSWEDFDFEE